MKAVLPITYLGSIDYYAVLAKADEVIIERCESFPKQTLRNRCKIYGANGPLELTIPIIHSESKLISHLRFDNSSPWRNRHWQALLSGYKSSPFFEYFEEELKWFYESESAQMFDQLWELTRVICKLSGIKTSITLSETFEKEYPSDFLDLRSSFKPSKFPQLYHQEPYHQVFADKHGYQSNLSMIDLLCNEGRNSHSYLQSISIQ